MDDDPGNAAAPAATGANGNHSVVGHDTPILSTTHVHANIDMVEAARDLRRRGYALSRVATGEKRPTDDGWQLQSREPEDFASGDFQMGIVTGSISDGLVCVDLDGIDPIVADRYLLPTGMEDGRQGRERSHRWYRLTDTEWPDHLLPGDGTGIRAAMEAGKLPRCCGSRNFRASREKGAAGVELKGAGTQVVVPPSVHPSGVRREWTGGTCGEPAEISYAELIEAIERMATDLLGWRRSEPKPAAPAPSADWHPNSYDIRRARAYIRKMGPAIEGDGGDQHTYEVCCALLDFVDEETAWPILLDWNRTCRPPWGEQGLRRKLREAAANRQNPIGCKSAAAGRSVAANPASAWEIPIPPSGSQGFLVQGPPVDPCAQQPDDRPSYEPRTHDDRQRDHLQPRPMIIDGLLPAGGIGAIVAQPGAGKTLLGIELTRCIAAGVKFAGRSVSGGGVLYICSDSPSSTERRMLAIPEEVARRIYTLTDVLPLPNGWWPLHDLIRSVHARHDVTLVVIDTWDSTRSHQEGGYAVQDGITEEVMRKLRHLADDLGIAIVVVHHATRADGGRPRGSQVFDARADWIGVADRNNDTIALRSIKVRDGNGGAVGAWKIETVDVGDRPVPILVEVADLKLGGRPDIDELVYDRLSEHRPWVHERNRIAAALRAGPRRGTTNREVEEAFYRLLSRPPGGVAPVTEGVGPRGQRLIGRGEPPPPVETAADRCRSLWAEHPAWTVVQIAVAARCAKSTAGRVRPTSHEERPT